MKKVVKQNQVKKTKINFKKLWEYFKGLKFLLILALLFAAASAVLVVIGPDKISEIFGHINAGFLGEIDMGAVAQVGIYLIIIYSASATFAFLQDFIIATVTLRFAQRLRRDLSKKINKVPQKFFNQVPQGEVLSRITNDVSTLQQSLSNSLPTIIASVAQFIGCLVMMFITEWRLALCTIATTLLGIIVMIIIFKKSQKYFIQKQISIGQLNAYTEEMYSGHDVVRISRAENQTKNTFKKSNNDIYTADWKSQFYSGVMYPVMSIVGNLGYVVVCVVGSALALSGIIDFSAIIAFMIYVRLFSNPLTQIAESMTSVQSAIAASNRVFGFLESEEMSDESKKEDRLDSVRGDVTFKNVRFSYPDAPDKTIIKNFSAKVKAGQKVAIVGPTGAGKTTLVNLLMRFYELNQPVLVIDGKLTDYKIFDNGKSIKLLIDDDGKLEINGQKTQYATNMDLPKNKIIKFNQDFELIADDKVLDQKIKVLTGNQIDNFENIDFAIAYYGDIFIDGVPTKALTRENIHNLFSMVLQDTWMFEGTVRENLVYSMKGISDERLHEVCKACDLDVLVSELPNGLDSLLSENINISAGQKQLFTIARAMVKNSPMLILDEATSSVDTRTELIIQRAMDNLMQGRTSFVIAHRLSTIKNADLILVIRDGDIVEKGKHEELLDKNGFYADLYNSQFQNED